MYKARRKNIITLSTNLKETKEVLINFIALANENDEYLYINNFENKITAFLIMTTWNYSVVKKKYL